VGFSYSFAQPTTKNPVNSGKPLVLQFPADGPYGVIIKLDEHYNIGVKNMVGSKFAEAQGRVELPLHEAFMFVPNHKFIEHPEVLSGVPANSFVSLLLERIEAEDRVMPYICKLTGLKRLDLADTELSDKGLESVALLSNLQYLQLHEGPFTGSFFAHITPLKNLKFLRVTSCTPDTKYFDSYSSMLPAVRVLILGGNHFEDQDLLFLRKFPQLQELRLDHNKRITDKGLKYLLQCKEIGQLNVDDTAVTANGLKQLAPVKIRSIVVPRRFSKSDIELVQKALKTKLIAPGGPVGPDAYQLFAPLH